jgi:putative heme-binding domain-containing protein
MATVNAVVHAALNAFRSLGNPPARFASRLQPARWSSQMTHWVSFVLSRSALVAAFVWLGVLSSDAVRAQRSARPTPEWIWTSADAQPNESACFRRTFSWEGRVRSAALAAACDNELVAYINGVKVLEHRQWQRPARIDVKRHLVDGENVIAVECRNDGSSAAGLLLQLVVAGNGRQRTVVATDNRWQASSKPAAGWQTAKFDAESWKAAHSFGRLGVAPWGDVSLRGGGNAGEPQATNAELVAVPQGFRVELLYSVPKATQGSWVSMTNDAKGRLICSDQSGPLYRVTPGDDAKSTKVERLDLDIGAAQGLLWAFDSLYVVVNGGAAQGSGLYRCRDTSGDGKLDNVTLLKKLDGGGEHGPHAVKLGPDGKLWVIAGNHTKPPQDFEPASPHRNWAEDQLLPRNPDGNGHATGIMAPGGWIARTDADGKQWEFFCAGFRNSYDIDFNQDGELFTYDADMEWDTGTPWYRPTRVNHAVSDAEFGWRFGTGKWPAYYPDSLGAVVDIGLGSPTGIAFGTGAKFPAKYQRALYINDWTYGKIYAVHMRPAGASYTADFEVFAEAKPLPATDIVVNNDGALYFTIGGRGVQSGLYRVTYAGDESTAAAGPIEDAAAAAARNLRHKLEAFHSRTDAAAIDFAWPHLSSSDRLIRYAARAAVEHQNVATWKDKALADSRPTATIQLTVALARAGTPDSQSAMLGRLDQLPWDRLTEEQTLEALRAYSLAFIRLGKPSAADANMAVARLSPLYPAQSENVNRELCQLLVYLDAPQAVSRSMDLLKKSTTQQDQLHYAFVLRNAKIGWTADERKAYFSWLSMAEAKYRGGASFKNFIIRIRQDAVATLSEADRVALKEVIEGREQVDSVAAQTTRQFVHNWQLEDLLPMLDQLESGRSFERGREAYQVAQCYKCHRFAGDGGATGPDLTGAGNRFSARDLLESVVAPSKVISDQYKGTILATVDGEQIAGRVIEDSGGVLRVRTDPLTGAVAEIKKDDIESQKPATISEMPQGAINVLTKEEILDLVAYLRSGGDAKDKAFAK